MADEQHRLAVVLGKTGHDRVIVGEAPVTMNLDEAGEEPLDEVLESGTILVARDLHPLPGSEGPVELRADRFEPPPQRLDLALDRERARQRLERLDLLQENGDRLFEFENLKRHIYELSAGSFDVRRSSLRQFGERRTNERRTFER